jgi:hypothetical protein
MDQPLIVGLIVIAVVALAVYTYWPRIARAVGIEPFANAPSMKSGIRTPAANPASTGSKNAEHAAVDPAVATAAKVPKPAGAGKEGFADFAGGDSMGPVPMAAAAKPQGCYPREQLNPGDLLPHDANSTWAQVNPTGAGDLQGKNFLSAGALVGVNTIGQSLRNANYQLRAEPPNPQVAVGPFLNSTIEPDLGRRPLE